MRGDRTGSCRALVAAAGYGKTTALRRMYTDADTRWFREGPNADLATLVADAAKDGAYEIVIDDLPSLSADQVSALTTAVLELAEPVNVVLASRLPPLEGRRWRGGIWVEVGPSDLALTADAVEDLMDEYGLPDRELAARVYEATAGWPALVHLAAETLRVEGVPSGPLVPAIARPHSRLAAFVAEEVLATLPPDTLRLLRRLGELSPVDPGLCRALGHKGVGARGAEGTLELLRRAGLLTRGCTAPVPGAPAPETRVVPIVAEVVGHGVRRNAAMTLNAARWYDEHGPAVAATRAYLRARQPSEAARVLDQRGEAMLAAGHAEAIVAAIGQLPADARTRRILLLLGDALRETSELEAAGRAYELVAEQTQTGQAERWDAALAWRVGRLHYQRGSAREALAAFARAQPSGGTGDDVFLVTFAAHAHVLAGDIEAAVVQARRAVDMAAGGDDGPRAYAHAGLALALGFAGDAEGSAAEYARATAIAEQTGDVLLLTRIATNSTFHLLNQARYVEALETAQRSARYAAAAGSRDLRAIATANEADALSMLGRYDEAVKGYELALALYQRHGSRRLAGVYLGLGEVYRRRGWREQARAAYEDAVRVAEAAHNANVLVVALAGLALVVLDDDPDAARRYAEKASQDVRQEIIVPGLLAKGWIAVHDGDVDTALKLAGEAARITGTRRDRAGLADALELRAAAEPDKVRQRTALREAQAIWTDAGAAVEAARVQVIASRLAGAGTEDRLGGLLAAERLALAGALAERPGTSWERAPAGTDASAGPDVGIRAFGRFEVLLDGAPVPAAQWQSRKARDLLRILVARRGRPVPRGELCELLWPDDDASRTGHRLSVLLSIVRGVLDPAKAYATDHYLIADQSSIALDVTRVRIDVEDFLEHVAHGRRLFDRGALDEARALLVAVERQYRADAFEDEPYAEWSGALREEARAAFVSVLRMLARATREIAGPTAAAGYLLRLLEKDPYDEAAHRALVRTLVAGGQHGEARRAFDRYGAAMRAIGVRPPDTALLR